MRLRLPLLSATRQIDRYIFRQSLAALVAVTAGLVALIWLTQSLRFVELVVNRGLSLRVFLQLSSLQIPYFVAVILPITTFVVVQFVYQRLSGDRELTVMRASGLSPWAIARPALAVATVAALLGYTLNLWVVPQAYSAFRQYQFEIRNRVAAFLLQEGVFTTVSDDLTVYIRARDADGQLRGILIEDGRQSNNPATILAERGQLVNGPGGAPRVLLINGSRQEIDRRTGRLNVLTFAENAIDLATTSHGETQRFRDINEMTLPELLHPAPGVLPDRDLPKLVVEANRRLCAPLSAITYTLVALVAGLMGTFRRHGGVIRPLGAVLVVVALLAGSLLAGNLAAKQPGFIVLMWLDVLVPMLACSWALFGPQLRLVPLAWQARMGAM